MANAILLAGIPTVTMNATGRSSESGGNMSNGSRIRLSIEITLAGLNGTFFLLALVQRNWMEAAFGFSPDQHDGSVELIVASVLLATTIASTVFARVEWRRRTALANPGTR